MAMLFLAALTGCGDVERTLPAEPLASSPGSSPPVTTCVEATEVCNEVDDDCDGLVDDADPGLDPISTPYWFTDLDGDGFGIGEPFASCLQPPQSAASGMDCDDTDPEEHPGAEWYVDDDGDTFGDPDTRVQQCLRPGDAYVTLGGDCDDDDPRAAPGIDWYADQDDDGHGDPAVPLPSCGVADPRVDDATDCDDTNPDRHPGVDELCDGIDDDCDGVIDDGVVPTWYADADGDEWGDTTVFVEACVAPMDFVDAGGDCDDLDPEIHPEALEMCDGIDNDCDGLVDQRFTFGEGLEIATSVPSHGGDVGDVDGDGDPDVVASYTLDDTVLWFENLGYGTFVESVLAELTEAYDIRIADLDEDGALDVVACSYDSLGWYRNEGAAGFGAYTIVKEDVNENPASPVAADLDLDGDSDLLLAWWGNFEATWHENLGAGVFGSDVVISTLPNHPEDVRAADFDLDGDLDVLVGSEVNDTISWNENLGAGLFGPDQTITDQASGISNIETADLDGDGDPDVLGDHAGWHENLGGGLFDANPRTILDSAVALPPLHAADLDGDADPDVIVGVVNDEDLEWYENLGAGVFGPGQTIVELEMPKWAVTADVDGDGLLDVIASFPFSSATIQWFPGQLESCP